MGEFSTFATQDSKSNGEWTLVHRLRLYGKLIAALGLRGFAQRGLAKRRSRWIRTPLSDHPVFARAGTSDILVFDQIFVDREYRCIDGLKEVRVIVDAGANVGYSSAYLLSHFPDAEIIALEPDPENFKVLQRNLAGWGHRVRLLQTALWSKPATLNFRTETLHEGGEWGRQVKPDPSGNVEAVDISSLLDRFGLKEIDLLKVDIEGAEREVFASPKWLDRVRNLVIELHGPEEEEIFFSAIRGSGYSISRCEELTVCLSQRPA